MRISALRNLCCLIVMRQCAFFFTFHFFKQVYKKHLHIIFTQYSFSGVGLPVHNLLTTNFSGVPGVSSRINNHQIFFSGGSLTLLYFIIFSLIVQISCSSILFFIFFGSFFTPSSFLLTVHFLFIALLFVYPNFSLIF